MVERTRPTHFRYCGTATPDAVLLEMAYRFVSEFLEPVSNIGLKNGTISTISGLRNLPESSINTIQQFRRTL